jgi:hypothetical protein
LPAAQRFGRILAEALPVGRGKAAEAPEPAVHGNGGYRHGFHIGVEELLVRLLKAALEDEGITAKPK